MILQAAPTLPPGTPWWAAVALVLALGLLNTVGLVLVARAQRPKAKKGEKDPVAALAETVAKNTRDIADIESVLAESTDPDVRKRDHETADRRIATMERRIEEIDREARLRDQARHAADAQMGASLARIEGYLEGRKETGHG